MRRISTVQTCHGRVEGWNLEGLRSRNRKFFQPLTLPNLGCSWQKSPQMWCSAISRNVAICRYQGVWEALWVVGIFWFLWGVKMVNIIGGYLSEMNLFQLLIEQLLPVWWKPMKNRKSKQYEFKSWCISVFYREIATWSLTIRNHMIWGKW